MEQVLEKFERVEESLAAYFQKLRLIDHALDSSNIGICYLNEQGKFLYVNRGCCELWERSEEELLNLTYQEITHKDDLIEGVQKAELHENYEMWKRYYMPDGGEKLCHLEVSVIKDHGNFLVFFSKIISLDTIERLYLEGVAIKGGIGE